MCLHCDQRVGPHGEVPGCLDKMEGTRPVSACLMQRQRQPGACCSSNVACAAGKAVWPDEPSHCLSGLA